MPASFSVELAGSCFTLLPLLASLEFIETHTHTHTETHTSKWTLVQRLVHKSHKACPPTNMGLANASLAG